MSAFADTPRPRGQLEAERRSPDVESQFVSPTTSYFCSLIRTRVTTILSADRGWSGSLAATNVMFAPDFCEPTIEVIAEKSGVSTSIIYQQMELKRTGFSRTNVNQKRNFATGSLPASHDQESRTEFAEASAVTLNRKKASGPDIVSAAGCLTALDAALKAWVYIDKNISLAVN